MNKIIIKLRSRSARAKIDKLGRRLGLPPVLIARYANPGKKQDPAGELGLLQAIVLVLEALVQREK